MNLDELKVNWNTLADAVQTSKALSEQVVLSMIRNQSRSTISKARRKLRNTAFFFSGLLMLFIAILSGNPFDYTQWAQYVPAVLYAFLIVFALKIIISENLEIKSITLNKSNLRESLQKVIHIQERCEFTMERVWKLSLIAGFLLGVSLMARNFEIYGWGKSLLFTGANALTVIVLYLIAKRFSRQSPDTNLAELKMHLSELDELDA
jgi:hypothetical protein